MKQNRRFQNPQQFTPVITQQPIVTDQQFSQRLNQQYSQPLNQQYNQPLNQQSQRKKKFRILIQKEKYLFFSFSYSRNTTTSNASYFSIITISDCQ